jgi:hypothetical protein
MAESIGTSPKSKPSKAVAIAKKVARYAPPLIVQIVTFVATQALANEYNDYAVDDWRTPLAAKAALLTFTICGAISGLAGVLFGWGIENPSKFVRVGDGIIQLGSLAIAIALTVVMLQDHSVMKDAGIACTGANLRVCLPERSACSNLTKPPCDAYLDKDELIAGNPIGNPLLNVNASFGSEIGWAMNLAGQLEYRTFQYETYGTGMTVATTWVPEGSRGSYSMGLAGGTTTGAPFTTAPAQRTELAFLRDPIIKVNTETTNRGEPFVRFDVVRGIGGSNCVPTPTTAFDGSTVTASTCGANQLLMFGDDAIQAGKLCRYGCAGTNEECLGWGAPLRTTNDVFIALRTPFQNHVQALEARARANNDQAGVQAANDFLTWLQNSEVVRGSWDIDPHVGTRRRGRFSGFRFHYQYEDRHVVPLPNPPGPTDVAYPYTHPTQVKCQLQTVTASEATTCKNTHGSDCCFKTFPGSTFEGNHNDRINRNDNPLYGGANPIPFTPYGTEGTHIEVEELPRWPGGPAGARTQFSCAVIDGLSNLGAACTACTDPNIIPCGPNGDDVMTGFEEGASASDVHTKDMVNATVGFGSDLDPARFGTRDWTEVEANWCGAKLLQDTYAGFFGLTTASIILMAISAITASWDNITMIEEETTAKKIFVALGILLSEVLNVLLFLWPSFKVSMLLFVGHASGVDAAGIAAYVAADKFLGLDYEWAVPYYRSISIGIAVVQALLILHALVMTLWNDDKVARLVGVLKVALVGAGMGVLYSSMFAIFPAITATVDSIPAYNQMVDGLASTVANNETDYAVIQATLTGASFLEAQTDIGEEDGWQAYVVYFLTLAVGFADQIELIVLKKLQKKQIDGDSKVVTSSSASSSSASSSSATAGTVAV